MDQKEMDRAHFNKTFTLQGRVFFPHLLEPVANRNGRMQYSILFAWNFTQNTQATQELDKFLAESKQKYFPTIPAQFFSNPIKKWGAYARQDGKPNHEFLKDCYWLNAQSGADYPPPIVDQTRNPVMSKAEIYSGRNVVINLKFYKFDGEKKGLGVNLNAVMLMEGGEAIGGGSSVDVNTVFGDFAADMNSAPTTPAAPAQGQAWPPQGNNNNGNGFM